MAVLKKPGISLFMPRRRVSFYRNGFYHIFNRGNRKQDIFYSSEDYDFFLNLFNKYKNQYEVSLLCYCSMPNHFHLLLQQLSDYPLSQLMHDFCLTYSKYINEKYKFVGSLFQNRFKAKEINTDESLLYLSKYIHRNPKDLEDSSPNRYTVSSFSEYLGNYRRKLCNTQLILDYFSRRNPKLDYLRFVEEELTEDEATFLKPLVFKE